MGAILRFWGLGLLLLVLTVAGVARAADTNDAQSARGPLLIFAAASLKNALDEVAAAYAKSGAGPKARISYAGSSTLARQIEAGAPADIYISANEQWMDRLAKEGLIDPASRSNLLGNALVLVAPKSSDVQINLKKNVDLLAKLGAGEYLAMANTDSVPAGIYGRQALQWLGIWNRVKSRVAQASDVRAALHQVDLGQTPLGVVYASDAVADRKNVRVVATFPQASHQPIRYPVAAVAASDNPQDEAFLHFLHQDKAAAIFKRWGFRVIAPP